MAEDRYYYVGPDKKPVGPYSLEPVEHIRWPDGKAPKDEYKVGVILFSHRSSTWPVPFTVAIKAQNEVKEFNMVAEREEEQFHVYTFRIG
jgi:hypothetical protein